MNMFMRVSAPKLIDTANEAAAENEFTRCGYSAKAHQSEIVYQNGTVSKRTSFDANMLQSNLSLTCGLRKSSNCTYA